MDNNKYTNYIDVVTYESSILICKSLQIFRQRTTLLFSKEKTVLHKSIFHSHVQSVTTLFKILHMVMNVIIFILSFTFNNRLAATLLIELILIFKMYYKEFYEHTLVHIRLTHGVKVMTSSAYATDFIFD